MAVLPTGFGKSLIFRAFAEAKGDILQREVSVLIISPLLIISIVQDQILDANSMGIVSWFALNDFFFQVLC